MMSILMHVPVASAYFGLSWWAWRAAMAGASRAQRSAALTSAAASPTTSPAAPPSASELASELAFQSTPPQTSPHARQSDAVLDVGGNTLTGGLGDVVERRPARGARIERGLLLLTWLAHGALLAHTVFRPDGL